ncbi:hypothetical protein KKC08_05320 [Patescibacteria group bacterium]|nr:hypothetical protein [Patescibacteria group bacterium]MCG2702005.1 hypothetical protein [Candidatus Parcubacteria bacterium]MBU4210803.1 hypothetical protein [Patescibacteria group bacterium]MBU4264820.1 hypothetical protein [Patescibacteria group bacterium]MBU4389842.1 hypothetical protein [Patescibacteria group bacterium]
MASNIIKLVGVLLIPKTIKQLVSIFKNVVKGKGMNVKKWYMWYTTCSKCAKKYGKKYVVIIGKVE